MTGRLLTVREAADRLGISVKTLRGHIRNGRLRYLSVGLGSRRNPMAACAITIPSTCSPTPRSGRERAGYKRYPITYSGIKTASRRLRKRAGVSGFRFHDFRHDVGTKLLRETGNLKLVQRALNHADIKDHDTLAHVLDKEVEAAMEAVAESRGKSRGKLREVK